MIDPASIHLPDFLNKWYGPPARPARELPAECEWLPEALKEWHILASRWSQTFSNVKKVVAPEAVTPTNGKAIFLEDSTGDWRWAFDVDNPDIVYDAELWEDWQRSEENIGQVLTHSTVHDAISSTEAMYWCTSVPESRLSEILAPLTQVDFRPWRWPAPGYLIFMGDQILADIVPDFGPPGYFQVQVAATSPTHLRYLDSIEVPWQQAGHR